MSVRVEKLEDFTYNNQEFDILWVILDENSSPPLLPLLFATHLSRFGTVFESQELSDEIRRKRFRSLKTHDITDKTIRTYIYCLEKFLNYLEHCQTQHQTPGAHLSSSCSERFVNDYLNRILVNKLDSFNSLEVHQSALTAYFNWLDYIEIHPRLNLRIYRKTRQQMEEKSCKQHYIQYISHCSRSKLLNACKTLAEKLMIRMGFDVGLRTSELVGLRIAGKNGNLESLFDQLKDENYEHKEQFRYWLHGRYTKGGKSRWIYFKRQLLVDMKRYFETERLWLTKRTKSEDSCFFLRTDQRFKGTGIGAAQGTNVFKKRSKEAGLNPQLQFHDLRHTFATELFHAELEASDGRETRSESAALIVVAQRLGHAIGKDGHASSTTCRF